MISHGRKIFGKWNDIFCGGEKNRDGKGGKYLEFTGLDVQGLRRTWCWASTTIFCGASHDRADLHSLHHGPKIVDSLRCFCTAGWIPKMGERTQRFGVSLEFDPSKSSHTETFPVFTNLLNFGHIGCVENKGFQIRTLIRPLFCCGIPEKGCVASSNVREFQYSSSVTV